MTREDERVIEWECKSVLLQNLQHVDQREYERAADLYTTDAIWSLDGFALKGREKILEALYPALSNGTVRHIFSNTVVDVIDDTHAECHSYHSIYYTADGRIEDHDGPMPFEGPHRVGDQAVKMVRTDEGWRIASLKSTTVFRHNPEEPISIEIWAKSEGKLK
jgi:hypothetical protein